METPIYPFRCVHRHCQRCQMCQIQATLIIIGSHLETVYRLADLAAWAPWSPGGPLNESCLQLVYAILSALRW